VQMHHILWINALLIISTPNEAERTIIVEWYE
jgi:hypothetical protein